jgi:hypothetical protein
MIDLTDVKMALGAAGSIWINISSFNTVVGAISGIVFLGYGLSRWYYLIKNKGR